MGMAEIIAATSGIAGLMTLAIEVFKISKIYVEGVYGASKAVASILSELKGLKQVLWELDDLYTGIDYGAPNPPLVLSNAEVIECQGILKELREKLLERVIGNPHLIQLKKLTWPFSESKTLQLLEKLRRYLQLFQASVNMQTNKIVREIHQSVQGVEEGLQNERFRSMLNWLSDVNVQQRQDTEFAKCFPNAGSWLLEDERFLGWKSKRANNVLWCPGDPGCGKTVMMAIIVDHISSTADAKSIGIAYIYGDYKNSSQQTSAELLACLAKQLVASKSHPPTELVDLAATLQGEARRPNFQQSQKLLASLCKSFSRVYLLVDALDEIRTSERKKFLSALYKIESGSTSFLFTSRPNIGDIQRQLKDATRLPIRAADADIRSYVHHRIREDEIFQARITSFEAELVENVTELAGGMFLLAVLHINKLASLRTVSKIQQALRSVPKKLHDRLNDLYNGSIERIKLQEEDDVTLGMKILQWLAHAKMPMKVDELCHALAVECEEGSNPPHELDSANILNANDLIEVCAGLVIVEEQSSVIRLVHATAQEFLNEHSETLFPSAEIEISHICLAYLSLFEFGEGPKRTDHEFEERLRQYPFFYYATCAYGSHLRGRPEMELETLALKLLRDPMRLAAINQVTYTRHANASYDGYSQSAPQELSSLHVTATLGLAHLNSKLLEIGEDPRQKDSLGRTALHYASSQGHLQLIRQMQDAGSETRDIFRESALHQAIQNGHVQAVKLLIDLDADVESVDGGYSALHLACRFGHESLVDLLLDRGANLETTTFFASTAIHIAAESGQQVCVERLLNRGAEVNMQDNSGFTPLHLAAKHGFPEVARILLAHGALKNQRSYENEKSPLHLAAEAGHTLTVETLLSNGVDLNQKDSVGMTPLHHAASSGMQSSVECLMHFGCSVSDIDWSGRTAFDSANLSNIMGVILYTNVQKIASEKPSENEARAGSWKKTPFSDGMRQLSMSRTEIPRVKDFSTSGTIVAKEAAIEKIEDSLHEAAWKGDLALVQTLLDRGVDVNTKGISQSTAMHIASARGNSAVVLMLLSKGADSDCRTNDGKTPLAYAVMNGHLDVMRILIEQCSVDINSNTGRWTPLHGGAKYSRSAAVRMLTDAGANCRALDSDGKLPLHWAAEKGDLKTFRVLLGADPDMDVNSLDGVLRRTPLHFAAVEGHRSIVEMLLNRGADKNIQDIQGFYARRLAIVRRHKAVVNLLT